MRIYCFNVGQLGVPYKRVGETGVIVDIVGEKGEGLHVGLRADIDALPIEEKTELPFASKNHGVMHACGHDGHTTILLGAAYQLHRLKGKLRGRVRCVFQPGEEADGAAEQMIRQGALNDPQVDCMLALHLWPHLPFGQVGIKYGAVTASCDEFVIQIDGKGGHCARPHQAVDAIAIGAQVIQSLQYLMAKGTNPVDPVVVHIGKIYGGNATNVVADRVTLEGTTRAVSAESRTRVQSQMNQLVTSVVEAYGAKAHISYQLGQAPVINDDRVTASVEQSAKQLLGTEAVHLLKEPSMGADDFGAFAERVPSTYFRLGIQSEGAPCYDLHHPQFQFDDRILPIGAKLFTFAALSLLVDYQV